MAKKVKGKSRKSQRSRGSSPSSVVGGVSKIGGLPDYEVRNALETLTRATQIKADPKMMKAVGIEAQRQMNAIKRVM
jgi:hypothetical protein